ncbi:MAG: TolC family protein [Alphaproteobacteria bacterium]
MNGCASKAVLMAAMMAVSIGVSAPYSNAQQMPTQGLISPPSTQPQLNGLQQNGQNQLPLSQQTVGGESEMMNLGELLGINISPEGQGGAPTYLTLHDTIFSLVANNRKMKADLMSLHGSKLDIDRAEADYLPEVVVSGSFTRNGVNPEESDSDNEIVGGEWNQFNSNRLEVTLRQRLYDFGYRDESLKSAQADYARQTASFRSTLEDKMMEMVTLYGEVRRNIIQYRSINEYYAQGLELFKVVKDRTDNDLAPQSELEYVQLQLAEARQQLTQIASRITQGRRAFEQEIGVWPQQLAPMPSVAVERISQLADVNLPARRSAQVEEMRAEAASRQAQLQRISAEDKPNITLEVSGYRTDNSGNGNTTDLGANGTLRMNWTLYDGGRQDIAYEQALMQLKQSKFAVDYLGARAKGDSLRYLIEVKQADQEIDIVRSMIASSDQIIRHNTRLFQAGLVSATFMIGSLRERAFYRIRLVDLEHNRAVSSFGYAYAMGILPAQLGINIEDLVNDFDPATAPPEDQAMMMNTASNNNRALN